MNERRRRPRERREGVPGFLVVADGRSEVFVHDISPSGVGFIGPVELPVGEVVFLRIGLGSGRAPQRCRIVRSERLANGTFAAGAEFVDASPKFLQQQRLAG